MSKRGRDRRHQERRRLRRRRPAGRAGNAGTIEARQSQWSGLSRAGNVALIAFFGVVTLLALASTARSWSWEWGDVPSWVSAIAALLAVAALAPQLALLIQEARQRDMESRRQQIELAASRERDTRVRMEQRVAQEADRANLVTMVLLPIKKVDTLSREPSSDEMPSSSANMWRYYGYTAVFINDTDLTVTDLRADVHVRTFTLAASGAVVDGALLGKQWWIPMMKPKQHLQQVEEILDWPGVWATGNVHFEGESFESYQEDALRGIFPVWTLSYLVGGKRWRKTFSAVAQLAEE